MKYKIWNGKDDLITPIGEILTAEQVVTKYPMAAKKDMKFVIVDAPISMGVFMELEQTKTAYKGMGVEITDDMTDQEVLDAISYFEENPVPVEPTAEERIAAAMEYDNLMKY